MEKGSGGGEFRVLEKNILSGDALLWLAIRDEPIAACVTELIVTDEGKKCLISALQGDGMGDWGQHLARIEEFARNEGCTAMRLEGRDGWLRRLPGYRQAGIIMERVL